jgi:hypothetical protein
MSTATITTTAPPALWRIARAFICILHDLFGAPEDVAFRHTLTRDAYKLLLSWLRVGEAMMRRLLLIEAAAYPKPNTRPLLHAKRPRKPRALSFDHDKPEDWRVSFRCFASTTLRQPRIKSRGGSVSVSLSLSKAERPCAFHSSWPLAERYEALLRVFNDPAPYARRLAQRLHARPHTVEIVLRAPPEYEHRVDNAAAFTHSAERAWPKPDSS